MTQKVLVISDIHGKHKLITKAFDRFIKEGYDKIIFLGDFCDGFGVSDGDILRCFNIFFSMKRLHMSRVFFLIGNHDIQYMIDAGDTKKCSGFRQSLHAHLNPLLIENKGLFDYILSIGKYLFSHAGVNELWFIKHFEILSSIAKRFDIDINDHKKWPYLLSIIPHTDYREIFYEVGTIRGGLESNIGGPLWCDVTEMIEYSPIAGFHQIVGHSEMPFIYKVTRFGKKRDLEKKDTSVTFTDVLNNREQFLTLEIEDEK